MELLVVGLGSMGKRRARLIRGVEPSAALAGVDFAPARREEASWAWKEKLPWSISIWRVPGSRLSSRASPPVSPL